MKLLQFLRRRMIRTSGLALILVAAAAASAAQEKIAFESNRDGNWEVYLMNADGTDQKRLTNNAAFDGEPAFDGNGGRMVFTSTRDGNAEVYILNTDGSYQTRLTNNLGSDASPSFSPDGSKIIFTSDRDGPREVYIMNADGSGQTRLTNSQYNNFYPSFSPDGSKIIYTGFDGTDIELWTINSDGTGAVNLTNNSEDDRQGKFSPDGSKITFIREVSGYFDVFIMNADGTNAVNLTRSNFSDDYPSFSPDGSHIAYMKAGEITAITSGGSGDINLTNNPATDSRPVWSTANDVPSIENISLPASVNEGDVLTLMGTIADDNSGDSHLVTIDWGEGHGAQIYNYPAGTTSFVETHVYNDDNPANSPADNYTINITVDDHRFGRNATSAVVTVNNVAPILSNLAVSPSPVLVGAPFTLSGDYDDPGYTSSPADEGLRVYINWGDGNSVVLATSGDPGSFTQVYSYPALGTYNITVTVTDNDLGSTSQTIPVTVGAPPTPSVPIELRIDSVSKDRIGIAWVDTSDNEDGFIIERCSNRGCNNLIEVARSGAGVVTFVDTPLFANTQYYYRVRSFNLGGVSDHSNVVAAKTLRK